MYSSAMLAQPRSHMSLVASATAVALAFLMMFSVIVVAYYLCNQAPRRSTSIADELNNTSEPAGPRPRQGLDPATLVGYPNMLYSQVKIKKSGCCCSICLADYKDTDMLRLLPDCDHVFHQHCVDPWLLLHSTCPLCRKTQRPPPLAEVVVVVDSGS